MFSADGTSKQLTPEQLSSGDDVAKQYQSIMQIAQSKPRSYWFHEGSLEINPNVNQQTTFRFFNDGSALSSRLAFNAINQTDPQRARFQ